MPAENPTGDAQLYQLAKTLLSLDDLSEMLDAVVQYALATLNAERGFLVLIEEDEFDFRVIKNWSPEEYEEGKEPISRSIVAEVLARKTPLLIEDATSDKRFLKTQSVLKLFIRSVLAAPLKVDKKPRGVLYLESRSMQHFFGERELSFFQELLDLSARILQRSMQRLALEQANAALQQDLLARYRFEGIITRDESFLRTLEMVAQAAGSELPVLLQGPSGTGKELLARAIHANSSRSSKPLLTINCSALSPALLESELFGYTKGAFTGATHNKQGLIAAAHQGTLFLDEVSELPKELQAKLLRTLQFGEVQPVGSTQAQRFDVRFVAATNRDLEREVSQGGFRQDLYYRLNAVIFMLPALKERKGDILLLFYHFLAEAAKKANRPLPEVTPRLERVLEEYSWPGNIRELENEAKRLLTLTPQGMPLTVDRLSSKIFQKTSAPPSLQTLEEQERELIELHLRLAGGNRTQAAETLGVSREGLRKMMKRYGLD